MKVVFVAANMLKAQAFDLCKSLAHKVDLKYGLEYGS